MSVLVAVVLLALGLALLLGGAELMVRGATRLAELLGVSPLIIGLTIVAYGTSAPEVVVSAQAAVDGHTDIALGNVIGSNIFNVFFILGVSATILPLAVSRQLVRFDVPVLIVLSVAVWLLALDGSLGRIDSLGLVAVGALHGAFLVYLGLKSGRKERAAAETARSYVARSRSRWLERGRSLGLVAVGLTLLVLGSRWVVEGAVAIATLAGLSQLLIGLTIVAAGTSLPEVAASVVASLRGERDMAVGNVIGSNVFNIVLVLGLVGVLTPLPIAVPAGTMRVDIPVMVAAAIVCLPIFFSAGRISRWEGALLLAYFVGYMAYRVLDAVRGDTFPLAWTLALFVLPLALLTTVVVVRETREHRRLAHAQLD